MNKLKIVWVCEFSNETIRERLHFRHYSPLFLWKKIRNKEIFRDLSQWITNGINEFKYFNEIELHIISYHPLLRQKTENIAIDGVFYHFFKSEDDSFYSIIKHKFIKNKFCKYEINSRIINNIIEKINPHLIHLIGAENPHYSSSIIHRNKNIPILVSLQTLMSDPNFLKNYPIEKEAYKYRSEIEIKILKRADFIGTPLIKNYDIISKQIETNAIFLNIMLALSEPIKISNYEKKYDFVYFAKEIEKAADWAVEAFRIAFKENPKLKLLIVGGYTKEFKYKLDFRINECNMSNNITFTGTLPTHDDVINKIKEAKIALLPLKIDYISGTIREAMSNGLPVITTKTLGTPTLNKNRESILISEPGDFASMAEKMLLLIDNKMYADRLRNNAIITLKEKYNNTIEMQKWVEAYHAILNNYHDKTPIPQHLLLNI